MFSIPRTLQLKLIIEVLKSRNNKKRVRLILHSFLFTNLLNIKIMETLCEISINYQHRSKLSELPKVVTSKDAEEQFRALWSDKLNYVEEMYIMLLNRANKILGYSKISLGGISGTVVDTRVVFQTALKANASYLILCHNHPSSSLRPSDADIKITKNIKAAGVIMDIALLDHLILTEEGYYSFADSGIL